MGKRVARKKAKRAASARDSWPTRLAAAAELSVLLGKEMTAKSLEAWLVDPACPLPRGRGPISKAAIFQYLLVKRGPGRPANPASSATKDAQAAIWQAKADTLLRKVIKVDSVNDAADAAIDELRRDFTEEIPNAIAEMIGKRTPDEITEEHRSMAVAALNRFAERMHAAVA